MATEQQLRSRMRQLEQQIAQLEAQARQTEQRLRAEMDRRIQAMQQDAHKTFQRKLDETAETYARRIREFQEDVIRQSSRQMEQLRAESEAINAQVRSSVKELEQCTQQLQHELDKLKKEQAQEQERFRNSAHEARLKVQQARSEAEGTPHSFFCPMEFDTIDEGIRNLENALNCGMYQAATSDANSLALSFRLLRIKVEQAFMEWMQAFEDYRCILCGLNARLNQFESATIETSEGSFRMGMGELNFWSSGTYAPLAKKIRDAYEAFATLDDAGILGYLNEKAGSNRNAIFEMVTQGRKWEDELSAVINCITNERIFSDQRITIALQVAEMMEQLNFSEERSAFHPPRAMTACQDWFPDTLREDPMGTYELELLCGGNNRIRLLGIPSRQNGLATSNKYYLTVDYQDAASIATEQLVSEAFLDRFNQLGTGVSPTYLCSTQKPEQKIAQNERLHNTAPNPGAQIRYLEKKYT